MCGGHTSNNSMVDDGLEEMEFNESFINRVELVHTRKHEEHHLPLSTEHLREIFMAFLISGTSDI